MSETKSEKTSSKDPDMKEKSSNGKQHVRKEASPSSEKRATEAQSEDGARGREHEDELATAAADGEKKEKKSNKAKEKSVGESQQQEERKDGPEKDGKRRNESGKGSSSDEEKKGKEEAGDKASAGLKKDGNGDTDKKKQPESDAASMTKKTVMKITKHQAPSKNGESSNNNKPKKDLQQKEAAATQDLPPSMMLEKNSQEGIVLGRMATFPNFLYKYEQSKGLVHEGPPQVVYKVLLRCMSRNSETTRELAMWKVPKTGADIKGRIERAFQIPRSFQGDLSFNGMTIEDGSSIARLGIRQGAMLEMTYLCEAQVEHVRVVLEWFQFLYRFQSFYHYSLFGGFSMELHMVVIQGINECIPKLLAEEYLYPPDDKTKYANRVYFLQENGHIRLLDSYNRILWEPWRTLWQPLKFIEADCIAVLAALGRGQETRKILVKCDAHGYVLQSLLRVPVSRFNPLEDTSGAPGWAEQNNYILKCLLENAVKFLFNFRDNAEVHMDICCRSSALDQLLAIAHCPTFSIATAQDCMCVFACCMHSADAHKYMCRNPTLEGIADCITSRRNSGDHSEDDLKLLQYYTQVTLAHLVMSSGVHMSIKAINKIVTFMANFLSDLKPSDIHRMEQDRHHAASWSTFLPYVKPLLAPPMKVDVKRCSVDQKLQRALYRDSLETMMFALQVMCCGDANIARRNLLDEKLLGYVFCLSTNVPEELQERARNLCSSLRRDSVKAVPLPKLHVIAKSKLAVMRLGLKKVMDRSAKDLKLELSTVS